jgi:outer membrane biosynthesis protein TonB
MTQAEGALARTTQSLQADGQAPATVSGGKIPEVNVIFDNEPVPESSIRPPGQEDSAAQADIATSIVAPRLEVKTMERAPAGVRTGGQIKVKAKPIYPQAARVLKLEGTVVLAGTVGIDGALKDIKPVSGDPILVPASMDAARKMQFVPYQFGDKKIEAPTQIIFNFRISDSER